MKKIIFSIFFLLIVTIGVGYATFVFDSEDSKTAPNASVYVDDMRDNYILGEVNDPQPSGQKYNVYFFAQSDFNPGRNPQNTGPNQYYYGASLNPKYGQFSDGSYYKVLENVTEIKVSDIHTIGTPTTSLKDMEGYSLTFNGWSLDYLVENYKEIDANTVYGNFPYGNSSVNLMYFNLSLESLFSDMYKDNHYPQKNSDSNTLDVYVFPIYTTGKDYYDSKINHSSNDAFRIFIDNKENYFNQDRNLQEGLNQINMSNIRAYSYNTFDFDNLEGELTFDFAKYSWDAWVTLSLNDGKSNFIEQDALTTINEEGQRVGSGIYNIHVFYKEYETWYWTPDHDAITLNEIKSIDSLLKNRGIQRYCSFQTENIILKEVEWVRAIWGSFYIVFERQFEPHLIGGPSQSLEYNQISHEYQFNRDVNNHNVYILKNVRLNVESDADWYTYFEDPNYQLSNIVFGIKIDLDNHLNVPINIGQQGSIAGYEEYNQTEFVTKISEASSSKNIIRNKNNPTQEIDITQISGYDKNVADLFYVNEKANPPYENENEKAKGYGIYSLAIRINYGNIVDGDFLVHRPTSVDLFAYRQHNIYIAIYDENDTFHENEIITDVDNDITFVKPNIVYDTTSSYSFIAPSLYLDTLLDGNEEFINTKNNDLGIGTKVSLKDIISYYEQKGYEIYDRVSGQIINLESLQQYPFRIMKNYIFHVRRK